MPSEIQTVFIYAPVSGKTLDITQVPDDVFAQKMVGDGIAVEPDSDLLCAPADAVIDNIHSSHHALTMTTPQGVSILIHIGLETVRLKGKGFDVRVKSGQHVKKGDPLIKFDLDYIRKNAKSSLSVIVVTNPEKVNNIRAFDNKRVKSAQDVILELSLPEEKSARSNGEKEIHTAKSWNIRIVNESGVHARPAAVLASAAKRYASEILLNCPAGQVNVKSLVALMGADLKKGDEVTLYARGSDAVEALEELIPLLSNGMGEDAKNAPQTEEPQALEPQAAAPETSEPEAANRNARKPVESGVFTGVSASEGVAVGVIVQAAREKFDIVETGDGAQSENGKLQKSLKAAKEELTRLHDDTARKTNEADAAVFLAQIELLDDPELIEDTETLIGKGKSAAFAFDRVVGAKADKLARMKNKLLAGRANDLRDVKKRVIRHILGKTESARDYPQNAILIAKELSPSQTAGLDTRKIAGFGTMRGGATSHAAILARALSMPAIVGLSEDVLDIPDGTPAVLDAVKGELRLNPSKEESAAVAAARRKEIEKQERRLKKARLPAKTLDGVTIEVAANISGAGEVQNLIAQGAAGVGLLRSEFLFANRTGAPDEAEQAAVYAEIATGLGKSRFLVVRTLDAGGDKPLPYLDMPKQDNPFLSVRGIRLSFENQDLFAGQIRAILSAAGKTDVRILLPMVTVLDELATAKKIIEEQRAALNAPAVQVGIMVEVPAVAVMADVFAPHVDFFSVGTNDLSQYVTAADRTDSRVAPLSDAFNPAVLRLIKMTCDGAKKYHKPVAVCGNLASDTLAVPVLTGLGVSELSVAVPAVAKTKECVRRLDFKACQMLANAAVNAQSARQARDLAQNFLNGIDEKGEL